MVPRRRLRTRALINRTMAEYLDANVFRTLKDSFVYVERTLENGSIRRGLIGMVDLDAYDYSTGSVSPIRATERTVVERIPPRMRVRREAPGRAAAHPDAGGRP